MSTTPSAPAPASGPPLESTNDPAFYTKLQIAADPVRQARETGRIFRAVAADCAYGDQDDFRRDLSEAGLPFAMALKPRRGT
ncbi:transposase [Streptomyces hirsutus]